MTKYSIITDVTQTIPVRNVPIFIYFLVGSMIGITFGLIVAQYRQIATEVMQPHHPQSSATFEHLIDTGRSAANVQAMAKDNAHTFENDTVAQKLYGSIRILCWILTTPSNHLSRAVHIKRTWGKRCNKLVFISTAGDAQLDAVALNVSHDTVATQWGKTKLALKHIYDNYRDDADWFLKTDDSTYVIVENLRYMLHAYATSDPIYFGYKMRGPDELKQGYFDGGPGYVLSQNALHRFAMAQQQRARDDTCNWYSNAGAEDVELGKCMEAVGVVAGDTRDELKRGRFFLGQPEDHLMATAHAGSLDRTKSAWYRLMSGLNCCSDHAISFHHIRGGAMYVFEYFLYHLRSYGLTAFPQALPRKVDFNEVTAQLSNERPDAVSAPTMTTN